MTIYNISGAQCGYLGYSRSLAEARQRAQVYSRTLLRADIVRVYGLREGDHECARTRVAAYRGGVEVDVDYDRI